MGHIHGDANVEGLSAGGCGPHPNEPSPLPGLTTHLGVLTTQLEGTSISTMEESSAQSQVLWDGRSFRKDSPGTEAPPCTARV